MFQKFYKVLGVLILAAEALSACAPAATPTPQMVEVTRVVAGTPQIVEITSTAAPTEVKPIEPTALPEGSIQMTGAGATFPFPLYSRWFYDYAFIDASVKFNYQSIGSGGGIKQITAKTVDFGASDAILNDDQIKAAPGIQMFPTVAGAEAIIVNLKGADGKPLADKIKFPFTSVADIYLGKITKWNDPVLVNANPGVQLPDENILVVHRSDGSGTTYIFTDYLSKVSQEWKDKVGNGTSVQWPVGLGGKGNEGVYGTVSQNDGAIGYVELAYAIQNAAVLNLVQNKAQQYIEPSPASTQAAMADFGSELGDKLAISIVDGPGEQSYPIAGYTYILMYMDQQDCTKAQKLLDFFKWAYGSAGDKDATDLQYVALPQTIKDQVNAKLTKITCQGKPLGN
jgi:phosphate transport system substrate-binding protein